MKKRYWAVFLTYTLLIFSIYLSEPVFIHLFELPKESANAYAITIGYIIAFLIILLLMKPDIQKTSFNIIPVRRFLLYIFFGFIIYLFIQILAALISMYLFDFDLNSVHSDTIKNKIFAYPFTVLNIVIFAPIIEEIIFRKIILNVLRKRIGLFLALLISSFAFGIAHMEWTSIIGYTSAGLVLGILYIKSNKLIIPIIIHMIVNTFSVLGTLLL